MQTFAHAALLLSRRRNDGADADACGRMLTLADIRARILATPASAKTEAGGKVASRSARLCSMLVARSHDHEHKANIMARADCEVKFFNESARVPNSGESIVNVASGSRHART